MLVTAIGATVLAVGGVGYYAFISNRYKKIVKKLIEKLVHFIQLAQKGEVSEEEVDNFLKFLQDNQKELLSLKLNSEIDELFDLVYDYTIQFAQANGFETDTISEVAENNKVITYGLSNLQKQYIVLMLFKKARIKFLDIKKEQISFLLLDLYL